jgi:DNA-binding transcriptional regulator YiaG
MREVQGVERNCGKAAGTGRRFSAAREWKMSPTNPAKSELLELLEALMVLDFDRRQFEQRQMDAEAWIGAKLREHRERAGISLREVARRVKFTASYVSDVEQNRRRPTKAFVDAFMEALNK